MTGERTLRPWALYLLMGINAAVWIANVATGIDPFGPAVSDLLDWGANSAHAVIDDGEFWRLLTATFLHGGVMHLALNLFGLWGAGLVVNHLFGNLQFLLIYLGSALTGSALSLHFSAQHAVSVGASGAVFGVLGALLVSVLQRRERLPPAARRSLVLNQLFFIGFALVQGFASTGIDNAAHVGGLLSGCALAWVLVGRDDAGAGMTRRLAMAIVGAAMCSVAIGVLVHTAPEPRTDHKLLFDFSDEWNKVAPGIQAAESALQSDLRALKDGKLTQDDFMRAVRARHLPAYRAASQGLERLKLPPGDPRAQRLDDIRQQSQLVAEMMEIELRQADGDPAASDAERMQAISARLQAIQQRLKQGR